jgi:hypothetical protein
MLAVKSLGISFFNLRDFRQKTTEKPNETALITRRTEKDVGDRLSNGNESAMFSPMLQIYVDLIICKIMTN